MQKNKKHPTDTLEPNYEDQSPDEEIEEPGMEAFDEEEEETSSAPSNVIMTDNLKKITKIGVGKDRGVNLEYYDKHGKYSVKSTEPAIAEFYTALQLLAIDVQKICELPVPYAKEITVRGLSVFEKENGTFAIITATKKLAYCNTPWNFNTPYKKMKNDETSVTNGELKSPDGTSLTILDNDTIARLDRVLELGLRYLNGERGDKIAVDPNQVDAFKNGTNTSARIPAEVEEEELEAA